MPDSTEAPIVCYDGDCGLCQRSVQFILQHEKAPLLRFGALQSEATQQRLTEAGLSQQEWEALDTLYLIEDGSAYSRSQAACRIAKYLKAPWSLLAAGKWIPQALADCCYDAVARRRHRLFPQPEGCGFDPGFAQRSID
jgi:predicted DCC family thiol-disulfide oxidoreductase YuxK